MSQALHQTASKIYTLRKTVSIDEVEAFIKTLSAQDLENETVLEAVIWVKYEKLKRVLSQKNLSVLIQIWKQPYWDLLNFHYIIKSCTSNGIY